MAMLRSDERSRAPVPSAPRQDAPRQGSGSPEGDPAKVNMPPRRTWLTFMLVLLANFLLVRLLFPSAQPVKVPYTLFRDEVARKNVQAIYSRGASITGRFAKPVTYPRDSAEAARLRSRTRSRVEPRPVTDFATELPAFADPGLEALLIASGVEISAEPIQQSGWLNLLYSFAPALMIIALYVWMYRRAAKAGGGLGGALTGGLGKSTARRFDQ